jgi:hypothetical protein
MGRGRKRIRWVEALTGRSMGWVGALDEIWKRTTLGAEVEDTRGDRVKFRGSDVILHVFTWSELFLQRLIFLHGGSTPYSWCFLG